MPKKRRAATTKKTRVAKVKPTHVTVIIPPIEDKPAEIHVVQKSYWDRFIAWLDAR